MVTKDELTELLWKDTFVTPNALTRLVAQLRRELGDVATEAGVESVYTAMDRGAEAIYLPGGSRSAEALTEDLARTAMVIEAAEAAAKNAVYTPAQLGGLTLVP